VDRTGMVVDGDRNQTARGIQVRTLSWCGLWWTEWHGSV